MNAEIINVGTELLLGNIVNTDARDLAVMLAELGINVYWQTVVGDNPARLRKAVEIAADRADVIITTGGLGPTFDDLTKQTVCAALGAELYFDERAKREIEEFFRVGKGGTMPENNLQQCWLPVGCTPFYNTCGTAPGCGFQTKGKTVLILPGPPKEMNAMMRVSGMDYLRSVADEPIFSHNIMTFGMGESRIESILRKEMESLTNPTLAPYAKEAEVRLRVTAKAPDRETAERMMAPVIADVQRIMGDKIYGMDDIDSLEKAVLCLLRKQGRTFAAAESCTGGLIAKRITDLPGSSAVFRGGVTVYTNDVKMLPGVKKETLDAQTAVSREVAVELAECVRTRLGADYGIGVTGVAGPDTDGVHAVGTVFVSLACPDGTHVRDLQLGERSDRSRIRTLSANHGFDMLRRHLCGMRVE